MSNQFVPEDDFPMPPVNEEDEEDGEGDESSNSLLRPLPRPLLIDIADRFVVMPNGANAVVAQKTIARVKNVDLIVIFMAG